MEFDWLRNPSLTSLAEVVVSISNLMPWLSILTKRALIVIASKRRVRWKMMLCMWEKACPGEESNNIMLTHDEKHSSR